MSINIPQALDRLCYRYPSMLVDAITEHEPGRRLVAVKNVTVSEEFFQGHFPGTPIMPAVLMVESLSQVAAILLLEREDVPAADPGLPARRQRREIPQAGRAGRSAAARNFAGPRGARRWRGRRRPRIVGDQIVAECELLLGPDAGADRHRRERDRAPVGGDR